MQVIDQALSSLRLGAPARFKNLAIFPLLADKPGEAGYLLLDEALEAGLAEVTEVSESGSVPELFFDNHADKDVLLVDGEELVGAKQNRVLNLSILVGAGRKIVIPVSCVEAGRWHYSRRDFSSVKHKLYLRARAMKMAQVSESLRTNRTARSDQGALWNDIEEKMARMKAESRTSSMEDLCLSFEEETEPFVGAFAAQPCQAGAVFAINGEVRGAELFDSPATFAKYFAKLLSSYAMDAIDVTEPGEVAPVEEAVRKFLDEMKVAAGEQFKAAGEGQDLRLSGERLAGGGLVVGEKLVHLAAFRVEPGGGRGGLEDEWLDGDPDLFDEEPGEGGQEPRAA